MHAQADAPAAPGGGQGRHMSKRNSGKKFEKVRRGDRAHLLSLESRTMKGTAQGTRRCSASTLNAHPRRSARSWSGDQTPASQSSSFLYSHNTGPLSQPFSNAHPRRSARSWSRSNSCVTKPSDFWGLGSRLPCASALGSEPTCVYCVFICVFGGVCAPVCV